MSAKIQQLLNTLKRPKRRPLPEFYEDDDIELEIAANPKDPNAPKPEGSSMTSAVGEQLVVCICDHKRNNVFICSNVQVALSIIDHLAVILKCSYHVN